VTVLNKKVVVIRTTNHQSSLLSKKILKKCCFFVKKSIFCESDSSACSTQSCQIELVCFFTKNLGSFFKQSVKTQRKCDSDHMTLTLKEDTNSNNSINQLVSSSSPFGHNDDSAKYPTKISSSVYGPGKAANGVCSGEIVPLRKAFINFNSPVYMIESQTYLLWIPSQYAKILYNLAEPAKHLDKNRLTLNEWGMPAHMSAVGPKIQGISYFMPLAYFAQSVCFMYFKYFMRLAYFKRLMYFKRLAYFTRLEYFAFLSIFAQNKYLGFYFTITTKVYSVLILWLGILLLLSGDVERNPGPTTTIKIHTYNARGLRCNLKLKRILNSCHKLIQSNPLAVFGFQETHLTKDDIDSLKFKWRHGFVLSPGTNKQCGVLLLYGDVWTQLASEVDTEGRRASVVLGRGTNTFIFNCIYAPNDHNINFFANIYDKIAEQLTNFPDSVLNVFGDFNVTLESIDGVNRQKSNNEVKASKFMQENNRILGLVDTFRAINPTGGFTWVRDKCGSRLDMIFSSKCDFVKLKSSCIDWTFDDSDHAMVCTELEIVEISKRGPGLPRVDASILDRSEVKEKITKRLDEALNQIPINWDPHMILEFIKMSIRSIFSEERKKVVRIDKIEIDSLKSQIQILKIAREKFLLDIDLNSGNLNLINDSIASLENELEPYNLAYSKNLAFRARAKWYEEGEKSNKYFLNMIKRRSAQTSIEKIVTEEGEADSQEGIATLIKNFYSNLYSEKETIIENDENYLKDLPQLSDEDKRNLDCEITLEELKKTLKECNDSAPGPDGIPYSIYLHFWNRLGPVLLNSWQHSVKIGKLSDGQRLSTITLLPKDGKDKLKIENWRPITLTNCDIKIFTKLLSKRVSSVLHKIIIPTQTAYIPGRQVADNLRLLEMYRSHCERIEKEAILVSLDAKKAFDSVNHKYMYKTLKAYGFSDEFVQLVQMLYNDLKADILVNGYRTVMIKILRSVKQGCSLSCCLFILCIDPLLRKIESNKKIVPIQLENENTKISNKTGTFADDVFAITADNPECLNEIFVEYNRFSQRSGIELNVNKTEILRLGTQANHFKKLYHVNNSTIESVESIKICGITFSNNKELSYQKNIKDKIVKLEKQLIMWLSRGLTFEGKVLIVKTFGISQILYSLQVCHIEMEELKAIERIIFKFIWNKKWNNKPGPDRIKRCIMKQDHKNGGLKAPDIFHMNSALKVKQLLRSSRSSHPIKLVQDLLFQETGYNYSIRQEYCKFVNNNAFIKLAQVTINQITDKMRGNLITTTRSEVSVDKNCWNLIASTNIKDFIARKRHAFNGLFVKHLNGLGIITYFDLLNESKFPRSDRIKIFANNVLASFPKEWKDGVESVEMIDNNRQEPNLLCFKVEKCIELSKVTVSHIRRSLLPFLDEDVKTQEKYKLENIIDCADNPFLLARNMTISTAIRSFKFRLLHKDIFSKSRLHKIGIVDSNLCDHCSQLSEVTEDLNHLLWECPGSRETWNNLQSVFNNLSIDYQISLKSIIMGIQNAPISVELVVTIIARLLARKGRPKSLSKEVLINEIKNIMKVEQYITMKKGKTEFFQKKWEKFESLKN
jgi:exonuclease III